eukprot:2683141-Amphidinium_carterae.1
MECTPSMHGKRHMYFPLMQDRIALKANRPAEASECSTWLHQELTHNIWLLRRHEDIHNNLDNI